jgi:NAD(P)-dependent dehydrogenase (short-subunit alcohol dehydrogenase family)
MRKLVSYDGVTALITGASSGIGRLLALRFASAGARVALVARRADLPERLVDAIIKALAKGKHEITFPRFIAAGYVVRAIAPGFMRRSTKRQTLEALAKEGR